MVIDNNPIKSYLNKYPDASLQDYWDHLETEKKEANEKERERCKNYEAWFDNAVGKYFKLNFNNQARMVFQLKRNKQFGRNEFTATAYEILDNGQELRLEIEKNRFINYLWLPNPYENTYRGKTDCVAEEISEDEYNKIIDLFSDMNDKINAFKSLWS